MDCDKDDFSFTKKDKPEVVKEVKKDKPQEVIDPNKYRFTRFFAAISLAAVIFIAGYILITVVASPSIAVAIEKVSSPLNTALMVLGGVIATYMGVSNKWGRK